MGRSRQSKNLDRWVRRHQNKHLCQCGCGDYIIVKREHHKDSVGIPRFLPGHNLAVDPDDPPPEVPPRDSFWDKLTPEEQQRRLGLLKSFGRGEENPAWQGGRRVDDNGYIQLRLQDHPFAKDGYVYEHRLVVELWMREHDPESKLLVEIDGEKYLSPKCVVHHVDEVKTNNKLSNLCLLPNQRSHAFIHGSKLPLEEKLRRIALGITHSRPLE